MTSACSGTLDDDNFAGDTSAEGGSSAGDSFSEGGDSDSDGASTGDPGDGDSDPGGTGGDSGGDPGGDGGGEGGEGGGDPGQLTAGEWSDLDNWDFWMALGLEGSEWSGQFDAWGFDTRERVPVRVLNEGVPVVDARVVLRDANADVLWTAHTDNEGDAQLWPALLGGEPTWPLTLSSGGVEVEVEVLPSAEDPVLIDVLEPNDSVGLDLMFVVDTTGSMDDELSYLKTELDDVITRVVDELPGQVELRLSVNFYRDVGDDYEVRSFPFTADIDEALTQLSAQSSGGGGDYPEAVHSALADATNNHAWSESARSRLLFMVLDAPPHDTTQVRSSLEQSVTSLAEQGVRVIPLGASGIDKSTEFLMRNIDIVTGGTYTFLTNDSGIGGDHIEPTVGEFDVEQLNDQMVRLIVESMG